MRSQRNHPETDFHTSFLEDILNRLAKTRDSDSDPDSKRRMQDEQTRHLSKYIFPRQYNLDSIFVVEDLTRHSWNSAPQRPKDFQNREQEIKVGGEKLTFSIF